MRTTKRILNALIRGVIGSIVVFVLGVLAIEYFTDTVIVKPYVVQSGSMEPAIKTASVVFSIPQKSYNPGEVITFAQGGNKALRQAQDVPLITHRIAFKLYPNGVENPPVYSTAGDANEEIDRWEVKNEDIVGKVVFSLPYLGYAVDFAKRPYGFLLLVIVPATIVIYEELKVVGRELFRFLKKIREDIRIKIFKRFKEKKHEVNPGDIVKTYIEIDENTIGLSPKIGGLPKSSILLPVLGSALVLISFSTSFFFDVEQSIGNIFGAAESFGPPLADHLVINEVMFDPPNTNACGSENDAEWVEIYNPTSGDVNLDTWSVGDTLFTDDLPNVNLPAGGFAVVSDCTLSNFNTIWPLPGGTIYIDISSAIGNGLNNGGEHVRLLNGVTLIDGVSYGSNIGAFSPSVPAPVANHSIERDPDGFDTDTAADFVDRTTPTPGS